MQTNGFLSIKTVYDMKFIFYISRYYCKYCDCITKKIHGHLYA